MSTQMYFVNFLKNIININHVRLLRSSTKYSNNFKSSIESTFMINIDFVKKILVVVYI